MGLQHIIEAGANPKKLRADIHRENRRYGRQLVEVANPPRQRGAYGAPFRAFRSRKFCVQAFAEVDGVVRLSVNRADINPDGSWAEGITWDDLQRVKAEAGYADREAVEVYPPDSDVVNVANMRHLWVLPAGARLPFTWRGGNR